MKKHKQILDWYLASGVDETIGEKPMNRFDSADEAAMIKKVIPVNPPVSEVPTPVSDNILQSAIEIANKSKTLAELETALQNFTGCSLKKTAKHTVFGEGPQNARIMFVGEAPGADEDRIGKPFVGVSGQLLDKMLAAIGLSRHENAYISNIIPWRPPGNRSPSTAEIAICLPFIQRHIELVHPDILVLVGGVAMSALMPGHTSITKTRGNWLSYQTPGLANPIRTMAIFHPAFLLRNAIQKKPAWRDMLTIKEKLKND